MICWEIICSIIALLANLATIFGVIYGIDAVHKYLQDRKRRKELLKQIKDLPLVDLNDEYSMSKWGQLVRELLILNPEEQNPFKLSTERPQEGKFYEEDLKHYIFNFYINTRQFDTEKINKTEKENK